MIPEGWSEYLMRDVFKLASGEGRPNDVKSIPDNEHAFPVYGGNGILGYSKEYNSSSTDIIIGRVGEYCGITRLVEGKKWITDNALYTKSVNLNIERTYLARRLQHFGISKLRSKGGQPLVSQEPIYSLKFALPPLAEQRRISEILSTWDRAIGTVEALIANAREQKKALMQSLLTGKKRLPGFKTEWTKVALAELGLFRKGRGISKSEVRNEGLPCVRYGEIYTRHHDIIREFHSYIDVGSATKAERINFGDILFTCSGETAEEIGKCVAFLDNNEAYAGSDIVIFTPRKDNPTFLAYLLNAPPVALQKAQFGQGNSVVHISSANLAKLKFALPTKAEQDALADIFMAIDRELAALVVEASALRQEKSALMQQLLTGKRRVKMASEAA